MEGRQSYHTSLGHEATFIGRRELLLLIKWSTSPILRKSTPTHYLDINVLMGYLGRLRVPKIRFTLLAEDLQETTTQFTGHRRIPALPGAHSVAGRAR